MLDLSENRCYEWNRNLDLAVYNGGVNGPGISFAKRIVKNRIPAPTKEGISC
jgi:hypothetical protein